MLWIARWPALVCLLFLGSSMGCERQRPSATRANATAEQPGSDERAAEPEAARPGPSKSAGPRIDPRCFDVYAECPATVGLPAVSADGQRVAVPDFGPVSPRDEFVLTVRIVEVAGGAEVSQSPLLTQDDRARSADPMTGQLSAEMYQQVEARVATLEQTLKQGGFTPLVALGRVHQQQGSPS
ncbi:MAG: hypothetical protein AAGC55_16250, partial [Myxococcota bacterium]